MMSARAIKSLTDENDKMPMGYFEEALYLSAGILPWHTEGYLNRSRNLMVLDRI